MKRYPLFVVIMAVGLSLFTTLGHAETAKIAFFDVQKVLSASKRGIEEGKTIQARRDALDKVIQKKQDELKALKESLEKKAAMLSDEAKREREKEYQQKLKELDRLVRDANDELKRMQNESLGKLMKSLNQVVNKLGKEENYTLILEVSIIAYAPEEIDITDKVIKVFDAAKE